MINLNSTQGMRRKVFQDVLEEEEVRRLKMEEGKLGFAKNRQIFTNVCSKLSKSYQFQLNLKYFLTMLQVQTCVHRWSTGYCTVGALGG